MFFLEGWRHPEPGAHDVPRPSYQESDFNLLCPVASGHLPLRQEWLELMEGKYTSDTVKFAFHALVQSHNETYNPSGKPLESADRKRTTSSANLPSTPEGRGTELPLDEHAPETEQALAQRDAPLATLKCLGQTLLFTKSGHLWVWGGETMPCQLGFAWP